MNRLWKWLGKAADQETASEPAQQPAARPARCQPHEDPHLYIPEPEEDGPHLEQQPAPPPPETVQVPEARPTPEQVLLYGDVILDMIDNLLPLAARNKAPEFFASVRKGVAGVLDTIEHTNRVSDAQIRALKNWYAGISKWIH